MRLKFCARLALLLMILATAGCGSFVAHRMAQAPNSYPAWLAPAGPVELAFDANLLTNFPMRVAGVGPPAAQLRYRVIEPTDFHLVFSSTNWLARNRPHYTFSFRTTLPGRTNAWTYTPRGTVVLLHGYGLAQFSMTPWALRLAEDGWRCVLVDLRGHGESTGKRIYYGILEARDLSQLLDELERTGQLTFPVATIGESYGASLALRWKGIESRLSSVVAIAPYASLSNATLNLCHEYARWLPRWLLKAGLKQLPVLLNVEPGELDTVTGMAQNPVVALFVAGTGDKIMPLAEVRMLYAAAAPGSKWLEVPGATHEAVPYYFDDLALPVSAWLGQNHSNHPPVLIED